MSARLGAWMNGEFVGTWAVDRASHRFVYDPGWLRSPRRRALSLSLPITATREIRGEVVANYFDNLLPDNRKIRERVARRCRARSTDAFALLQAIGRDCVGAVQLLPDGQAPHGWDRIERKPLTEAQVADILRAVPSEGVLGQHGDDDLFRISLAGAQEKTALLYSRKRWYRPQGATPTTHILKLPLGLVGGSRRIDLADSVENEWLCARILHHLGLPVADTEIARFEDQKVLAVRRFDRSWQRSDAGGEWIARLPQEDFCQAMGYPPDKKHESHGGPGMAECLRLLQGSADPGDRETFAITQLTFWLLAATDGHAKNFSIFLEAGDAFISTPLYDVISAWPYIGDHGDQIRWRKAALAMALRAKNAHHALHTIHARHWQTLAMRSGGITVWRRMLRHAEAVETALAEVESELPDGFPPHTWDAISKGMRRQVQHFVAGATELHA